MYHFFNKKFAIFIFFTHPMASPKTVFVKISGGVKQRNILVYR